MKKEPSVLDYVKARLAPWKGPVPEIPPLEVTRGTQEAPLATTRPENLEPPKNEVAEMASLELAGAQTGQIVSPRTALPWRSISAIVLALLAQLILEPGPNPNRWQTALIFYLPAFIMLGWAFWTKEWQPAPIAGRKTEADPFTFNLVSLLASFLLLALAYLAFGGNRFNPINLLLWGVGSALAVRALWMRSTRTKSTGWLKRLVQEAQRMEWQFTLKPFTLLWLLVFAFGIYFRFHQLAEVPPEMNSDHAEKLLDVMDVLSGQASIFFPRNTGREPLQFYIIAATDQVLGTGISFLSMKIGMALAGVITLPFVYLIGKEIASRRVGLLAMAFAGIAAWPNILSRSALRFSLYPLFVAPSIYFLLRGLRSGKRNDFILSGIFLGIGLLGYTPIRILPLAIGIIVAVYILHTRQTQYRQQAVLGFLLVSFFAIVSCLPLLRFAQENPALFSYRAFSRLTDLDQPLARPAGLIFLDNLKNAMLMFGWNNGQIWPVSIPGRPALDTISAALFYLGLVLLLLRYLRKRQWEDLSLLLAVPVLMLPSILSLAFPGENPAPNRASGAIVPVFLIVGLTLDGLLKALEKAHLPVHPKWLSVLVAITLFCMAASQNYKLVFEQYQGQYTAAAWNTSEMGQTLREFARSGGSLEASWVVKSAHWVDTRLVGMHAGEPRRDFGIDRENLAVTLSDARPKLFLVRHYTNPEERAEEELTLSELQTLYPSGWAQLYPSQSPGKEFWVFYAPPLASGIQTSEQNPLLSP
jgi:hypothetical protein